MKNKDILLTVCGICLVSVLLLLVKKSKEPESFTLDLSEQPELTAEHELVRETLLDVESFSAQEDVQLEEPESAREEALPVAGQPLPANWERRPAPSIYDESVELHPAVRRAMANTAFLAEEQYADPNSTKNLETAGSLRDIREQRHSAEISF